jgi:hypothetical protein
MRLEKHPEPRPSSNPLVTSAGQNVTGKVTEVTSFVTCYGIHYGIHYGIYFGFLDHVRMQLWDAMRGFPAGSDTICRPLPLPTTLRPCSAAGRSARVSVKRNIGG